MTSARQTLAEVARRLAPPAAALVLAGVLAGCATPPPAAPVAPARTTVVLLPDADGGVGQVTLATAGGTQQHDEAYSSAFATGSAAAPTAAPSSGSQAVEAAYADLLQAQPPRPRTFVLHFVLDRTALTDASKALLPEVLEAVRQRKPTEISIFGHADASGTPEGNLRLSAERAQAVADWLRGSDPTLDRIEVQALGDAEPAVPARGRAPEPRNRRAEIVIL